MFKASIEEKFVDIPQFFGSEVNLCKKKSKNISCRSDNIGSSNEKGDELNWTAKN